MIRRILELAGRRAVFKRRLPKQYGGCAFYASPEGGLRYWRPSMEKVDRTLLEAARETVRPGDVVWDIGANVGLFSFVAAGLAGVRGHVYAIEPDTYLVGLLRRSAALRNPGAATLHVLPVAAGGALAFRCFMIASRARSANFLEGYGTTQTGGVRESQTVVTVPLTWLATQLPLPDVLKIDAEGAEAEILRDGIGLLRQRRPRLICEVSGENQEEVTKILRDCRYTIFDGAQSRDERRPVGAAPWCTLAIPESGMSAPSGPSAPTLGESLAHTAD